MKDHYAIDLNDLQGERAGQAGLRPRRLDETASRYDNGLAPHEKEDPIMLRLIMASVCQICLGQGYVYANGKKLQCVCR